MGLRITCDVDPGSEPEMEEGATIWIVDVLRMSSTVVTALGRGCPRVYLTRGIDDALRQVPSAGCRLLRVGERSGRRLPGFDCDNSPASLSVRDLTGCEVVMTTTNGTRRCSDYEGRGPLGLFSFLNLSATGERIVVADRAAHLVAAGRPGEAAPEDQLAVGALIDAVTRRAGKCTLDTAGTRCLEAWGVIRRGDLAAVLRDSPSGRNLAALGRDADIERCARLDAYGLSVTVRTGGAAMYAVRDP